MQEDIDLLMSYRCSETEVSELGKQFSNQEIKDAFFSLPHNKTSGPDGYLAKFFTACWPIVGPEVTDAVAEFFRTGCLLKQWNATMLVLIPKVPNATSMMEFRPISCLNTLYKVIAKLLANRLKKVLSSVISHAQSAFIPGRLLGENVLLATEIIHGYNRNNVEKKAMLKVDLKKAFDSVRWDFVISTLNAIGCPQNFVSWIKQCITTPSFSVALNGSSEGYFQSSKGLRQGDPLSPYLFVLAMEVLSKLLSSRFQAGYITYHPKTEELGISHLMFADDIMIFFDGGESSLHGITEAVHDFASWSGLRMNQSKTQLFHAGLNETEGTAIARYGFTPGSLPIRYLGLPLMSRRLRISEYADLIDKVVKRFKAWGTKTLTFAGRVELIRTVIAGMVIFWMSTFLLPKGCISKRISMQSVPMDWRH